MNRRVKKKGAHEELPFDKYELYSKSVQSPKTDVEFLLDTYKLYSKVKPAVLREDFCGTFLNSIEWVKMHPKNRAVCVDLDTEPLNYGRAHYLSKLKLQDQERVNILLKDVLSDDLPYADIVLAANFSYFVFKTRDRLKHYFTQVRKKINPNGIFVLDCFGGSLCFDSNEEQTKHKNFTYYWHQVDFDPISNRAEFNIHFRVKGKKYLNVFNYDWRMWSIPELRDILLDSGFSFVDVFWEGTKKDGTGNGVFSRALTGEACQSWIAYLVAG